MNRQSVAQTIRSSRLLRRNSEASADYHYYLLLTPPLSALQMQRVNYSTSSIVPRSAPHSLIAPSTARSLNSSSFLSAICVARRSCASNTNGVEDGRTDDATLTDRAANPELARIAAYHIISIQGMEPSALCEGPTSPPHGEDNASLTENIRTATQVGIPLSTFVEQMPDEVKNDVFRAGLGVAGWVNSNPEWITIVPGVSIPDLDHVALSQRGLAAVQEEVHAFQSTEDNIGVNGTTSHRGQQKGVVDSSSSNRALEDVEEEEDNSTTQMFSNKDIEELVEMINYHLKQGEYRSIKDVRSALKSIIIRTQRKKSTLNATVSEERIQENELYSNIDALSSDQLIETLLRRAPTAFWIIRDFICRREDGETAPPPFRAPFSNNSAPTVANNFCGWASASNVPTRQDVYEILRYVPVNWGNMGNLSIPADVKKAHIRISSTLQWFRRQPFYFELRNIAGTLEIRRSCTLHPEDHGMTLAQAEERLQWRMANGTMNSLASVSADDDVDWYTDGSDDGDGSGAAAAFDTTESARRVIPPAIRSAAQWRNYRASVQPSSTSSPAAAVNPATKSVQGEPVVRRPSLVSGSGSAEVNNISATTSTILKFLKRVAPGYFTTPGLILQRYTKKNLTEMELIACATAQPDLFEVLEVPLKSVETGRPGRIISFPFFTRNSRDGQRYAVLLRRRTGADSARWRDVFSEDLMRVPSEEEVRISSTDDGNSKVAADSATAAELDAEQQNDDNDSDRQHPTHVENASEGNSDVKIENDVVAILVTMQHLCATWDRPLYLYVLLSDYERKLVGGYDGLCAMLRRHPSIFRCGSNFVCRADLSDPLQMREPELDETFATVQQARIMIREENPYLTPRDLAVVFYHCCPDDNESTTVTYFVQCCSPAMYAVLPPRLINTLLLFPDLFACREVSPGVFTIRKVLKRKPRAMRRLQPALQPKGSIPAEQMATQTPGNGAASQFPNGGVQVSSTESRADEEDYEDMDFAEDDVLSKQETIQAVEVLIPDHGVEASQLLLWVSMGVQKAASKYFGGVLKLVESRPHTFKIVDSTQGKMVYRQRKEKSSDTE